MPTFKVPVAVPNTPPPIEPEPELRLTEPAAADKVKAALTAIDPDPAAFTFIDPVLLVAACWNVMLPLLALVVSDSPLVVVSVVPVSIELSLDTVSELKVEAP